MSNLYRFYHLSVVILVLIVVGCASRDSTGINDYNQFAIKAAEAGLWNEAIYRWNQVITIDPDNAAAHNNLGVGYEAQGKITDAVASYERATELDPDSKYYRINYRRCRLHIRRSGSETTESDDDSNSE
ncbi:tetratricopeptide repeat protein [Candidatus Poribacteria bacterium]|nr:tetratricopeptide repeat protein [Candidatus Poribacteria bacterium]